MDENIDIVFQKLENIYAQMPETIGCISCGKCCSVQHPHCFYVEFLYMMDGIQSWTREQKFELHLACIKNYLSSSLNKKCVFLNQDKRCDIYHHRGYNCIAFGMIPKKVYTKRVKDVKKNFPGVRLGLESQSACCGGVKPVQYIGGNKLDALFEKIRDLDLLLGVSIEDIDESNNYMTFHDHYILFFYGKDQKTLERLTSLKLNGTDADKLSFLESIVKSFNAEKTNG